MKPVEILLVEDNAGDVVLIRHALASRQVPVNLHIAPDGEQALRMLSHSGFKPDLIIQDLHLPKISGAALLERWRSADLRVVVFSSSLNENERTRTLALGARAFVYKPTDLEAFMDAVHEIVEKWAGPEGNRTIV